MKLPVFEAIVSSSYEFQAGTYVIGDPFYVLPDAKRIRLSHKMDNGVAVFAENGVHGLIGSVAGGDGTYEDNRGEEFPVHSGTLAILNVQMVDQNMLNDNKSFVDVIDMDFSFDVEYDDGDFYIDDIFISTNANAGW